MFSHHLLTLMLFPKLYDLLNFMRKYFEECWQFFKIYFIFLRRKQFGMTWGRSNDDNFNFWLKYTFKWTKKWMEKKHPVDFVFTLSLALKVSLVPLAQCVQLTFFYYASDSVISFIQRLQSERGAFCFQNANW